MKNGTVRTNERELQEQRDRGQEPGEWWDGAENRPENSMFDSLQDPGSTTHVEDNIREPLPHFGKSYIEFRITATSGSPFCGCTYMSLTIYGRFSIENGKVYFEESLFIF